MTINEDEIFDIAMVSKYSTMIINNKNTTGRRANLNLRITDIIFKSSPEC